MKKKIVSLALVLALCLSLLPATALATGEEGTKNSITICGDTWTDATYAKTVEGEVTKNGAAQEDYNIYWDAGTSTLTLNNANIKLTSTEALSSVISANIEALNIKLIGTNSIEIANDQSAAFTAISNTGTIEMDSSETDALSIKMTQAVGSGSNRFEVAGIYTETGLTNKTNLSIDVETVSAERYTNALYGIKCGKNVKDYETNAYFVNAGTLNINVKNNTLNGWSGSFAYGIFIYGGAFNNAGIIKANAYTVCGNAYGLRGTNTVEKWQNDGQITVTATAYGGNFSGIENSSGKSSNFSSALSIVTDNGSDKKAKLINDKDGIIDLCAVNYGKNAVYEYAVGLQLDSEDVSLDNAGIINIQALEASTSGIDMLTYSKDTALTNSGTIEIEATTNGQIQHEENASATGISITVYNARNNTPYKTELNLESGSTLIVSATPTETAEENTASQAIQLQKIYDEKNPGYETAPQEINMSDDLVVLEGGSPLALQLEEYIDYGMYVYLNGFSDNADNENFSQTVKIITAQPLTGSVSISGTVKNENVLSAKLSDIPESLAVKYQWQVGDSADGTFTDIENATEATYTLTSAEVGKYIRVVVTPDDVTYKGSLTATTTQAVEAKSSSSSSSSSSSGNTTTKTETTTNPDGSTTKTETKKDGSVTETTTGTDGSVTKTETKTDTKSDGSKTETKTETKTDADGNKTTSKTETTTDKSGTVTESKTETKTDADGTKTEVKSETKKDQNGVTTGTETVKETLPNGSTGTTTTTTDANGTKTEAVTTISSKAVDEAKKNDEAVTVPVDVKATEDNQTAPTVKVELPKNSGETKVEIPVSNVTPGTVVAVVKPDGTEEIVKDCIPTENGIQLAVEDNVTLKVFDNAKDFTDTKGHWAEPYIDFASARELLNGISEDTFAPEQPTTRAMMWTVLARQDDTDLSGGTTWYDKAQAWAKDSGVSDGTAPQANVTRAQMVTMLWRAAGSPAPQTMSSFADVSADAYYAAAVAWAAEQGITNGVSATQFQPNGACTRAQIAAFLYRASLEN